MAKSDNPSKSNYSFFKCIFVASLLFILPLFPSQPPDFINQTILTKLWELLHLLFIGIAVSYGLFVRKNGEMGDQIESELDNSHMCLSGFLHVSSFFGDGHDEYLSLSDESNNCLQNPSGSDEKMMTQTWNHHLYFKDEPPVVVIPQEFEEKCGLDSCGKPKSVIDYKPLGLPVRSLRSRIVENEYPETVEGNWFSSDSKNSCKKIDKIKYGEVRVLTPINLEDKFRDAAALPSPIPWRSRSSRMELGEDVGNVRFPSPSSLGVFEFENIISQSIPNRMEMRDDTSSQSKTSGSKVRVDMSNVKPSLHSRSLSVKEFEFNCLKLNSRSNQIEVTVREENKSAKSPSHLRHLSVWEFESDKSRSTQMEMTEKERNVKSPSHLRPLSVGKSENDHIESKSTSNWMDTKEQERKSPSHSHLSPLSVGESENDQIESMPRSNLIETKENKRNVKSSSRLSTSSVGESEADHLKSQSFWSSIFSPVSSISSLHKNSSPSSAISIEESESKVDYFKTKENPPSPSRLKNDEGSSVTTKTRRFTVGSLSEMNLKRNGQNNLKNFSKSMREDQLNRGKWDMKPPPRGKSVRTIRPKEHCVEARKMGELRSDHTAQTLGETYDKSEVISTENIGRRSERLEHLSENTKGCLDDTFLMQSSISSKYRNGEKQNFAGFNGVKTEKELEGDYESFKASSDKEEEAQSDIGGNKEIDPDEVDKKADEFIAKFREQIRLQKVASIKRTAEID